MQKELQNKMSEFADRITSVNNQTKNKIDVLKEILIEYRTFSEKISDFNGYPVTTLIEDINLAKTKRKNVSKLSLHLDFLRIKDDALFKIKHNYSIIIHKQGLS